MSVAYSRERGRPRCSVQQSTKFDLAINLSTATALGLRILDKLIAVADKVVE
jgi:hypothetical protein